MKYEKDVEQEDVLMVRKHAYCDHPKISVIVPVYHTDRYLVRCLNSIVDQSLEEMEILLVYTGEEKPRCREIVSYFEKYDPRICVLEPEHHGYGMACNLGIEKARGEYLAIVDSDDFVEPDMYEEMVSYADALQADVVKTPFYECVGDEEKKECGYRKFLRTHLPQNMCFSMKDFGELLQVHSSIWSGIYRTSYMHEHGIRFVDEVSPLFLDVWFRIQTLIHTDRVAWLDEPYYHKRMDSVDHARGDYRPIVPILRWGEVHEYFKKDQENFDRYYGPYLIFDEYANTLGMASKASAFRFSRQEWEKMEENFASVKESMIEKSVVLSREQKEELLAFKRDPEGTRKILKNRQVRGMMDAIANLPMDARFRFPWQEVEPGEDIVIYGGGIVGKTFLRHMALVPLCNVVAVCDKTPERTGIFGIPVLRVKDLAKWEPERYEKILIALESERTAAAVRESLEELGIPAEKILWADPRVQTTLSPVA